jgi:Cap4 SAVED domain
MDASSPNVETPDAFLTIRCQHLDREPTLCGLCVGYENKRWRTEQFVEHVVEWLPEFALTPTEWMGMRHAKAVAMIRNAAKVVYETKKFRKRGEFGELFLHMAIRQVHKSLPAISKIYYKSATNDTVKGFDAVHVVGPPNEMELWLGEAKFYSDIAAAIRDVTKELKAHLEIDYLRSEFLLLKGKIDDKWPHAENLRKLLSPNTSLDEVFKRACIPVLLTYDSDCVSGHRACTDEYAADFKRELLSNYDRFVSSLSGKALPKEIRIHLFLLPLETKQALVAALDRKLKAWQSL